MPPAIAASVEEQPLPTPRKRQPVAAKARETSAEASHRATAATRAPTASKKGTKRTTDATATKRTTEATATKRTSGRERDEAHERSDCAEVDREGSTPSAHVVAGVRVTTRAAAPRDKR